MRRLRSVVFRPPRTNFPHTDEFLDRQLDYTIAHFSSNPPSTFPSTNVPPPQFQHDIPTHQLLKETMAKAAATTTTSAASNMLDVLIIGAGWSGLSAALKLSQAGRKVAILEARERIGGRAFTHTWSDKTDVNDNSRTVSSPGAADYWCDFGCSWMHGYMEGSPLKGLTDKYSIPVTIPSPRETVVVGEQGPLSQSLSQKLTGNLGKAQEAAKAAAHDESATPPDASTSLADFLYSSQSPLFAGLESEGEKKAARDLARMLHIPLGIELEKASLKWHGFENGFAGTDAAPQGGFTTIINKLVDEISSLGASIHTSQEVQSVRDEDQSNNVKITTKQGQEYTARTALVTIPIAILKKTAAGLFEPALPERRLETIKRVSVGNLNKVLLHYEQPWWNGKTGTFLVLPSSAPAPSSIKSDAEKKLWELYSSTTLIVSSLSPADDASAKAGNNASNSLLVMVGGEAGKQLEAFERLDAGNALHAYLTARIGGSDEASGKLPKHIFYSRWGKQAFTGGATTSPVSTASGTSPLDFEALSRPLWNGRLGFAGEHTEINHRGSAAGAYVSGEREANRLLAYLDKLHPRTANKL
ncbi:amine oxidase, flavin-containing [Pseudozyma hubeiensis SY62]|uniref:Amine oxidase, flavin-containing n=1 Tax=Pseudozyma hubeiensis (strain SY62) TaxID=1305764 RepID=R9PC47_PSEHS|nr:amine oxidase, flavin-containing [Pseudozyma hubeiensis SY62]GAC98914.1 amine oxidase, flavin-containing [Pseudozyma hubeiensis SY62]